LVLNGQHLNTGIRGPPQTNIICRNPPIIQRLIQQPGPYNNLYPFMNNKQELLSVQTKIITRVSGDTTQHQAINYQKKAEINEYGEVKSDYSQKNITNSDNEYKKVIDKEASANKKRSKVIKGGLNDIRNGRLEYDRKLEQIKLNSKNNNQLKPCVKIPVSQEDKNIQIKINKEAEIAPSNSNNSIKNEEIKNNVSQKTAENRLQINKKAKIDCGKFSKENPVVTHKKISKDELNKNNDNPIKNEEKKALPESRNETLTPENVHIQTENNIESKKIDVNNKNEIHKDRETINENENKNDEKIPVSPKNSKPDQKIITPELKCEINNPSQPIENKNKENVQKNTNNTPVTKENEMNSKAVPNVEISRESTNKIIEELHIKTNNNENNIVNAIAEPPKSSSSQTKIEPKINVENSSKNQDKLLENIPNKNSSLNPNISESKENANMILVNNSEKIIETNKKEEKSSEIIPQPKKVEVIEKQNLATPEQKIVKAEEKKENNNIPDSKNDASFSAEKILAKPEISKETQIQPNPIATQEAKVQEILNTTSEIQNKKEINDHSNENSNKNDQIQNTNIENPSKKPNDTKNDQKVIIKEIKKQNVKIIPVNKIYKEEDNTKDLELKNITKERVLLENPNEKLTDGNILDFDKYLKNSNKKPEHAENIAESAHDSLKNSQNVRKSLTAPRGINNCGNSCIF